MMPLIYFEQFKVNENQHYIALYKNHSLIKVNFEDYILHIPSTKEFVRVKFDGTFFIIFSTSPVYKEDAVLGAGGEWLFVNRKMLTTLQPEAYTYMVLEDAVKALNNYLFEVL